MKLFTLHQVKEIQYQLQQLIDGLNRASFRYPLTLTTKEYGNSKSLISLKRILLLLRSINEYLNMLNSSLTNYLQELINKLSSKVSLREKKRQGVELIYDAYQEVTWRQQVAR